MSYFFGTFQRIRSNTADVVKPGRASFFSPRLFLLLPFVMICMIAEAVPLDTSPTEGGERDATRSGAIRARKFLLKVVRSNASGRVYLFEDPSSAQLPVGKIFLLKKDGEAVMAFRTLKTYAEKSQIAARKIKIYNTESLERESEYRAIEKIGDIASSELTSQDLAEIQEVENDDATSSDEKLPTPDKTSAADENSLDELPLEDFPDDEALIAKELVTLDVESNWLSFNLGVLQNYELIIDASGSRRGSSASFTGLGLRYARTIAQMPFLANEKVQDSLALEAGFYRYNIVNYTSTGDSYSLLPLIFTARYNVFFGETFGAFGYVGILKNFILASEAPSAAALNNLGGLMPAFGLGLLFHIGPSWMLRTDIGLELLGAGLVLRF